MDILRVPTRMEEWSMTVRAFVAEGTPINTLLSLARAFQNFTYAASAGYIWQCGEPMQWHVSPGDAVTPPCIISTLCYGASVEDEWYCTALALQLSGGSAGSYVERDDAAALSAMRGLVVQVWDECDGDFILAEAAQHVPPQLTPETMVNRVFLHGGALHLLLPSLDEGAQSGSNSSLHGGIHDNRTRNLLAEVGAPLVPLEEQPPTLLQATAYLRAAEARNPGCTLAPPQIASAIGRRLEAYLSHSSSPLPSIPGINPSHTVRVSLPPMAAAIFTAHPPLASLAVRMFLTREEDNNCPSRGNLLSFPPTLPASSPRDSSVPPALTPLSLPLTRIHYAWLLREKCEPPPHSRSIYAASIAPPKTVGENDEEAAKALNVGYKLCLGLEVAIERVFGAGSRENWERLKVLWKDTTSDDAASSKEGAFRSFLQDPPPHSPSILPPATQLVQSQPSLGIFKTLQQLLSFSGREICSTLQERGLWPPPWEQNDSDSWLLVEEEEESGVKIASEGHQNGGGNESKMAREGSGDAKQGQGDDGEGSEEVEHLRHLLSSLERFVDSESGLEGIQLDEDGCEESGESGSEEEEEEEEEEGRVVCDGLIPGPSSVLRSEAAEAAVVVKKGSPNHQCPPSSYGVPIPLSDEMFSELLECSASGKEELPTKLSLALDALGLLSKDPIQPPVLSHPFSSKSPPTPQPPSREGNPEKSTEHHGGDFTTINHLMDKQLKGELKGFRIFSGDGGGGAPSELDAQLAHTVAEATAHSIFAQDGSPGPASTLLASLGVLVPKEWWCGGTKREKPHKSHGKDVE